MKNKIKYEWIDYESLLHEVCDKVYCIKRFGDYNGTLLAKVKMKDKVFWNSIYFGSCSGCDELEHYLEVNNLGCDWKDLKKKQKDELLKWFKETQIYENYYDFLLEEAKKDAEWDMDSIEKVKFLEENK